MSKRAKRKIKKLLYNVSLVNIYNTPAKGHLSKSSKKELISDRVKITIANKRKVVKKTNLVNDFIEQRSEKEEILVRQVVTTF